MPKRKLLPTQSDPIVLFRADLKTLQDKYNVDLILSIQCLPSGITPILQAKLREPNAPPL